MEAHLHMWLTLLLRWAHFIVGIAWIGASFYFNWLENHLQRQQRPEGIAGDLWAVHGGGFYYLKKYAVAPPQLPATLHWFKWEAYMTWVTGMALLISVFYMNAQTYMLSPDIAGLSSAVAISIGAGSLLASWIVYDLLCRSTLSRHELLLGILIFSWFALLAWILSSWLSGRAAFIHVGAAIGTVMVANVWRVIIPAQKDLVRAVEENRKPEASKGRDALQRSRHNNYFTLPVLFIMISGHYPFAYSHPQSWLFLLVFSLAAVGIRHYFNIRHLPGFRSWPLIPAVLLLLGLIIITAPEPRTARQKGQQGQQGDQARVETPEAYAIIQQRCVNCHAPVPQFEGFSSAPLGVELDSQDKLEQHAERVYQTVVTLRTMPLGNLTGITGSERNQIANWFENRD